MATLIKKTENEIFQIISLENYLKFTAEKDTVKNDLDFKLTNNSKKFPKIRDKEIYKFSITQVGSKRKKHMVEPVETVIVRGQQKFEIESKLNPVEIEINDH